MTPEKSINFTQAAALLKDLAEWGPPEAEVTALTLTRVLVGGLDLTVLEYNDSRHGLGTYTTADGRTRPVTVAGNGGGHLWFSDPDQPGDSDLCDVLEGMCP